MWEKRAVRPVSASVGGILYVMWVQHRGWPDELGSVQCMSYGSICVGQITAARGLQRSWWFRKASRAAWGEGRRRSRAPSRPFGNLWLTDGNDID
jgi:hypothetical protein